MKKYGLLGRKLLHSLSPEIHRELGNNRYDLFQLEPDELDAFFEKRDFAGINVTFFKHFYLQGELKGGYINMNDIRTTKDPIDRASQEFYFFERIIAFGGIFKV